MKNTIRKYGLTFALLASTALAVAPVQQASAKDKKVIGWSVAYFDHPVYQLMMKGAQALADKSDCKVIFADGKNDASVQASQIDNFIAQGVDGIIHCVSRNPIDSNLRETLAGAYPTHTLKWSSHSSWSRKRPSPALRVSWITRRSSTPQPAARRPIFCSPSKRR